MNRIKAIIKWPELWNCDFPKLLKQASNILASVETPCGRVWIVNSSGKYCLLVKEGRYWFVVSYQHTIDPLLEFLERRYRQDVCQKLKAKL